MAQDTEEVIALQTVGATATSGSHVVPLDEVQVIDGETLNHENLTFPSGSNLWLTMISVYVARFLNDW